MRQVIRLTSYVFFVVLLFPVALLSQDVGNTNFNLVWTASEKENTSLDIVWSADALQQALPDSIIQIKNVRADTDLDQDGKKEFIVPVFHVVDGVNRRSLFVFENSGNDSYDAVWSFTFAGEATQFVTADVSDLDGDGNLEILAVHIPGGTADASVLFAFEHTGTDNDFGTAPAVEWNLDTPGVLDLVRVAKAADLDNDGKQEVVLITFTTNPSLVIASVSDFTFPVWTTEVSDNLGTTNPDNAALGIGDMDNDGTPEVVMIEGRTDTLVIVEATGADTYNLNFVAMPATVLGTTVSVHGIDVGDVNGDGRDEAYMASLLGAVWVVATSGDASAISTSDIHLIDDSPEQWLEASLGNLGLGGTDFVIAASNASKAVDIRYVGGPFGDVTMAGNYQSVTVVDSSDVAQLVPGGIRVYGLDLANDMDGDGLPEIVFSRGNTRGGFNAPALFVAEMNFDTIPTTALPDSIIQIKNVRADTDLDQDGKKEFIVPVFHVVDGVNRRSLFVFENSGNDSYDAVWSFTFAGEATQFVTADVSDLDGDGNLEILAVHIPGGTADASVLFAFEHTGTDNDFGTAPAVEWNLDTPGVLDLVRVAKAADLDNDGKQEVVLITFTTNPSLVIASVSDFTFPVWTTEVSDNLGTTNPDNAALGIGDMDNDGTPEVVMIEGRTDTLVIVEATGADTYNLNFVAMPATVLGTTVSVHGIDVGDVNGDGRDEAYMASLLGAVWVVATSGDASAISTSDIHLIDDSPEQWLEASLGNLGLGGTDFVIAASNASKAVDIRYVGGPFGDVTMAGNYQSVTVVDSSDVAQLVPGGIRVYGLDLANDMDGDGLPEIVFSRGNTRGGFNAPAVFILEGNLFPVTSVEDELSNIPDDFELLQNYPNPFNPGTAIVYRVAQSGDVNLDIYNVLGQKVRTLVNGFREANTYSVQWDGKNDKGLQVPSGLYIYRLDIQGFSETKRMLLLH